MRITRPALLLTALALFLAACLVVRFDDPAVPSAVPVLFMVALALPSYVALVRWLGPARGIALLLLLSILPLAVEAYAVATGFPYGRFTYSADLGHRAFGLVPWTVAFAYLPMLLGAAALAGAAVGTSWRRLVPAGTLALLLVDLVIDPAVVHAGLWVWTEGGAYYGIPVSNFAGWVLTGAVYIALFRLIAGGRPIPGAVAASLLLILAFWTGYLTRNGLVIPALLGAALALATLRVVFRDESPA
ncbi:carotenoid biosynthesis protein [Methanoculleus sp. Wushi-C6]|uniref:Carotenoid biosynthesis protein n=1 Tax=Methanoculleus caldifontis TaxID=2651577 RepID=A0ABU3WYW3_9EURY|nr:carotenoid biosynthesis protein [Methanoculleus sp. Wushi-C6]MDV2480985.1 carotenoid biosynthesis protein [Methanoculleus sp. Wushi-C6]